MLISIDRRLSTLSGHRGNGKQTPSICFSTRFLESDIVRDENIAALYVFLDAISSQPRG